MECASRWMIFLVPASRPWAMLQTVTRCNIIKVRQKLYYKAAGDERLQGVSQPR